MSSLCRQIARRPMRERGKRREQRSSRDLLPDYRPVHASPQLQNLRRMAGARSLVGFGDADGRPISTVSESSSRWSVASYREIWGGKAHGVSNEEMTVERPRGSPGCLSHGHCHSTACCHTSARRASRPWWNEMQLWLPLHLPPVSESA